MDANAPLPDEAASLSPKDAGALAQTRDRPEASGATLEARARALWEAIAKNDPERALTFFFPLAAYEQVKDVANPGRDWRARLVHAYERDVRELHEALGPTPEQAIFLGIEIPAARAKWVEPGEEYNKVGYYRVYGSTLRWSREGKVHEFKLASLISWRGEWYVVHLNGFK